MEFALVGGAAEFRLAPTWGVTRTTCRTDQTSGIGEDFNVTINGTSFQLISTSSGSVSSTQGAVAGPGDERVEPRRQPHGGSLRAPGRARDRGSPRLGRLERQSCRGPSGEIRAR